MLTELQKRKLTAAFRGHDADRDGFLGKVDYEEFASRLIAAQDFAPDSPESKFMYTQTMAAWDHVQKVADTDKDGRVSLDEFLASYDVTLSDENLTNQLLLEYLKSVMALWDRDHDGRLSIVEYVALNGCYGISEEAAHEAFRHLDPAGTGLLNTEEVTKRVREFFLSDDPEAPGNWIIGPY